MMLMVVSVVMLLVVLVVLVIRVLMTLIMMKEKLVNDDGDSIGIGIDTLKTSASKEKIRRAAVGQDGKVLRKSGVLVVIVAAALVTLVALVFLVALLTSSTLERSAPAASSLTTLTSTVGLSAWWVTIISPLPFLKHTP